MDAHVWNSVLTSVNLWYVPLLLPYKAAESVMVQAVVFVLLTSGISFLQLGPLTGRLPRK